MNVGHSRLGATWCATAMTLLGASFAVMPLLNGYPVLMGQAWRYAVAAVALAVLARLLGVRLVQPTFRELGWLVTLAAVGTAGFNVLLLEAVRHATPSVISSIVGAAPIMLALLAPIGSKQHPRITVVIGAVLVTIGTVVGQAGGGSTVLGLLLALGVMACEVGFTLLAAPVLPRLGAYSVSIFACALAAPLLAGAAMVTGAVELVTPTLVEWMALGWLALVMTALAFVLWYAGVHRLGAARAGLFAGCVPIGALLASTIMPGQSVTLAAVLGAGVSAIGIIVGMTHPIRRRTLNTPIGAKDSRDLTR